MASAMPDFDAQRAADGWTEGGKTSWTGGKGCEDHGSPGKPAPIPSAMAAAPAPARGSVVPRGSVARLIAPIMNPDHKVHHLLKRVTAGYPGLWWAFDGVSNRVLTREEVHLALISSLHAFLHSWAWSRVRVWDHAGFVKGTSKELRIVKGTRCSQALNPKACCSQAVGA